MCASIYRELPLHSTNVEVCAAKVTVARRTERVESEFECVLQFVLVGFSEFSVHLHENTLLMFSRVDVCNYFF
jgi:hypothetical protein